MININIFSDFACPWCYIGEKRLEDAIDKLGLEGQVNKWYRAFELNPNAEKVSDSSTVERLAAKYNISVEVAKRKVAQVDKAGKDADISGFNFSGVIPANTFDAHRLMKLAENSYGEEVIEKLNNGLFNAYFVKNLVISDPKVLTEIGVEAGLDLEDIKNVLESDQYKEEVINDENIAHNLGISGVPYFIINDKIAIPGAISTEDFVDALKHIMNDSSIAEEQGASCATCDETGCHIN